jgi:two-component system, OmpR family, sensor histidine kinase KdpD
MKDDEPVRPAALVDSTRAGRSAAFTQAMTRTRGRLRVYLGVAPGAGKTYAMLAEGRRLADAGTDVVAGLAVTHGRGDTEAMLRALDRVPPREVSHRGATFSELDVDALLARRPAVVLVDELAHTCVPGSRHDKRWEDVEELLDAGIDVITSLNVQHLDSLNDAAEAVTGVGQRETVPDAVVASADRVEFVDISPERLRSRIARTDVLAPGAAEAALGGFFSADRLAALRQLALGWLDGRDLLEAASRAALGQVVVPSAPAERVVVALTGAPEGEHVLRRASQIAASVRAELIGVHVREPSGLVEAEPAWLASQRRLLNELGGRYIELGGIDVAAAVVDFAHAEGAHQLVLGATRRSHAEEILHGSVINKAIRGAGPVEVHVIPARRPPRHVEPAKLGGPPPPRRVTLPGPRRAAAWVSAVVAPALITVGLVPLRSPLGLAGALLCTLVAVVGVALLGGIRPALLATGVGFLAADFLYTQPLYSFRVARLVDVAGLIAFVVVAVAVGGLVDLLTRQGVQAARAKSEAENLARLAADSMAAPGQLAEAIGSIRRTFDLDGVTLLRRDAAGWQVEAAAGKTRLEQPDAAPYSAEIARGRFLALAGARLTDQDATLLRVFLGQLRNARAHAVLGVLSDDGPGGGH